MFAIQAAIKLGRKIQTVFEDETRDRELILPDVEHSDLPDPSIVIAFFEGEGKVYVQEPTPGAGAEEAAMPMGLYHDLWLRRHDSLSARDNLGRAYQCVMRMHEASSNEPDVQGAFRQPAKFYEGTNALFVVKQWRDGTDPKRHPIQRIGGTIVEIALDYVKIDPRLFGGSGTGERITRAFLLSLDELELAETEADTLLLQVFRSSLQVLGNQMDLIIAEDHLARLLNRVSLTLSGYIKRAEDAGDADKLRALFAFRREMLQDVIKTSAATIAEHPIQFFGSGGGRERQLLDGVLQAALAAVQEHPDLFSGRALAGIYAAALHGVAENASLISPDADGVGRDAFLRTLFVRVAEQLATSAESNPPSIFTPDLLRDIIAMAIDVTVHNAAQLIDPKDPSRQLLAEALQQVLLGVSPVLSQDTSLPVTLRALFSRQQLCQIMHLAFSAVARHPEALLHSLGDKRQSALAQIIATVATCVSSDPRRLLNGDSYVQLLRVALEAFAQNPDRLLDLEQAAPRQQVLAKVIVSVVGAVTMSLEAGERNLLTGPALLRVIEAAIAAVSGNIDGFQRMPDIVQVVMGRVLHAASDGLKNELDGGALVQVVDPLLRQALLNRIALDVSDAELILPLLRERT
jgi:hypothetical protein